MTCPTMRCGRGRCAGAGSAYPYHKDPQDSHLRIAPTYPSLDEVETASDLLCVCVKLAVIEKLLAEKAE